MGVAVMVATMNESCNADVCYGRVLDSTGNPMKDVAVHGDYDAGQGTEFDVTTDVDGYYVSVEESGFFETNVVAKITVAAVKNGYVSLFNNCGYEDGMELPILSPFRVVVNAYDIVLNKGTGFVGFFDVVVKDSLTEDPLQECKVRIKKPVGYALVGYTDGEGMFQTGNLLYGTYTITVTKSGYKKQSVQRVNVPTVGSTTVMLVSN